MSGPAPIDADPSPSRPILGRAIGVALVALFLMVTLGVFWVWQRAHREEAWRRALNAAEPIQPRQLP